MRHAFTVGIIGALGSTMMLAQYGTAPSNYYPDKYNGSSFTGIVTAASNDQLTLTYTKGSKTETFTGRLEAGCSVPRDDKSGRKMNAEDIPKGTSMEAFFNTVTKKVDQQKIKENVILAITFDTVNGQKIPDEKKLVYLCTNDRHVQFRFWGK
jgi:hypothetical protein